MAAVAFSINLDMDSAVPSWFCTPGSTGDYDSAISPWAWSVSLIFVYISASTIPRPTSVGEEDTLAANAVLWGDPEELKNLCKGMCALSEELTGLPPARIVAQAQGQESACERLGADLLPRYDDIQDASADSALLAIVAEVGQQVAAHAQQTGSQTVRSM